MKRLNHTEGDSPSPIGEDGQMCFFFTSAFAPTVLRPGTTLKNLEVLQSTMKYLKVPICQEVTQSIEKYLKISQSTSKYQKYIKVPLSTKNHLKVHRSTLKYLKVPQSTYKYLKVPISTSNYIKIPQIIYKYIKYLRYL